MRSGGMITRLHVSTPRSIGRNVGGCGGGRRSQLRVRSLPEPAVADIAEGLPKSGGDEASDRLTLFPKPAVASISREHALSRRNPRTLKLQAPRFIEQVLKFVQATLVPDGEIRNGASIDRFGKRFAMGHSTDVQHQHGAKAFFTRATIPIQLRSLPADAQMTQRPGPASKMSELLNTTVARAVVDNLERRTGE